VPDQISKVPISTGIKCNTKKMHNIKSKKMKKSCSTDKKKVLNLEVSVFPISEDFSQRQNGFPQEYSLSHHPLVLDCEEEVGGRPVGVFRQKKIECLVEPI
jgi:hypothetical protein